MSKPDKPKRKVELWEYPVWMAVTLFVLIFGSLGIILIGIRDTFDAPFSALTSCFCVISAIISSVQLLRQQTAVLPVPWLYHNPNVLNQSFPYRLGHRD